MQTTLRLPAASFGWAVTAAALVIALASPVLGAAADETGRRQPYLRVVVAGVVACTALLGALRAPWAALPAFMLAYVCANAAFTFFTAIIPAVSTVGSVVMTVTLSVGVGYIGGLVSLIALSRLVPAGGDVGGVFLPMALVYAGFALPVLLASPDFPRRAGGRAGLSAPYRRLRATFAAARRHRHLFVFLVGDFLYENAVASVITVMGLYARNVMGFPADALVTVFGPAIVIAALSAWFLYRPLIRRIGPKRAVLFVLSLWLVTFAAVVVIGPHFVLRLGPVVAGAKGLFVAVVAPLAGMGLAGVWSASRVLLTALTPAAESGEFWGLYNLSGRTASVLGDATWSALLTMFGEGILGYRLAVAALAVYVVLGAWCILLLPDVRPSAGNFVGGAA